MSALERLVEHLCKEGHVIRQAPLAFSTFAILVALLVWAIVNWHYSERINILTAQIADYRERLGMAPQISVFSRLSNKELKRVAEDLVERLTEFNQRQSQQQDQILSERRFDPKWTPEQVRQNSQAETMRIIQQHLSEQSEYTRTLAGDVSNVFRELQARLPVETVEPTSGAPSSELMAQAVIRSGMLVGPYPTLAIAQYIDRLAKQLP